MQELFCSHTHARTLLTDYGSDVIEFYILQRFLVWLPLVSLQPFQLSSSLCHAMHYLASVSCSAAVAELAGV